jgi:DNA-binding transcriptional regulator YiaG
MEHSLEAKMASIDHHYIESGLDNVFISGIDVSVDEDGDEVIHIPAINELHRTIALGIVKHGNGMSKQELRFLRTELGFTQSGLAQVLHCDKQTVGRWERGESPIDNLSQTLLRRLAIEKLELEDIGLEQLSRNSRQGGEVQRIAIQRSDDPETPYVLEAA